MRSPLLGVLWCGLSALLAFACGSGSNGDDSPGSGSGGSGASSSGSGGNGGAGGSLTGSGASGGSSSGSGGSTGSGGSASGGSGGAGDECGEIVTFETGLTPETVLHVSVDGGPDGTGEEADPFDSIEAAAAVATPGTAIRVHAGSYAGGTYLAGLSGSATAPIWIGGAPGEAAPVIGSAADEQAIHLSGARYVVLHDLEITGTTANGINADDGSAYDDVDALRYVVFRNLSIHHIGTGDNQDCLKLSGANDFWVLDSEFSNCSLGGSGVDHVGCHDGLVARNRFLGGGNAVQSKGGSRNLEIRGNLFRQNAGRSVNIGGSTGFEFFRPPLDMAADNYEASDIRVVANVFDRSAEALVFVGCVDCLAAHNTVHLPTARIIRILQETVTDGGYTFLPASNGRVVNNIFFYTRAEIVNDGRAINIGADTAADSFVYTNNLWYATDDVSNSEPGAGSYGGATVEGSVAGQDPGFADPAGGDFSIATGSPAAAAGVPLTEAPIDYSGACYASPPAVGALEVE